jgi:hypothetical protein
MDIGRWSALGRVALALLSPLLLFLIPTRWIEAHPAPCLFRALLGVRCPGCGLTRAVSCAAHGRWRDAWRCNRLVALVVPLLSYAWLRLVAAEWSHYRAVGDDTSLPRVCVDTLGT